ncbi:MAG: sulfoxide reductase heme-binding subunit YedZ [Rhodoferax sp.]|nr:sulfoxide reductase heme-binding subunit YedZ [Rhodoferax sp.]
MNIWLLHRAAKPCLLLALCAPLAYLVGAAVADHLGANPAEALIRSTGDWTLRLLCLTLLMTPLRVATGLSGLARFRRMVGVSTFCYGFLHLAAYGWLDMGLDLVDIGTDIVKRPFILVGFAGMVLLTALAATSFNRVIKAMGAQRWQALHRSVYAIAALAILHFFWMRAGKNDFAEVAVYAAIVGASLGWRLLRLWKKSAASAQ